MMIADTVEKVPLTTDNDGVIRVGGTRVTLDTVVQAFQEGATAEEIVQQYPSLGLADVYATIGFILRHPTEVETYLHEAHAAADTARRETERRHPPQGIRERLLARRPGASS